jgi:ABC-type multidrug transport system ATPase subunit
VFAELRGSAGRARAHVDAVVTELQLHDIASRRIDRCSTGMVAQLALARALIGDPALLIFDEPSRSLDAAATERMWSAIERRPRTAVLLATHRPEDLERCDRVINFTP